MENKSLDPTYPCPVQVGDDCTKSMTMWTPKNPQPQGSGQSGSSSSQPTSSGSSGSGGSQQGSGAQDGSQSDRK
jgi:hypothetical protein